MTNDPMFGGEPLAAGLTWFLDTFMTPAVDAGKKYVKQKKAEFDWGAAAESYRSKLIDLYGNLRVLGAPEEKPLDNLFTDLYILDDLTARRRFNIQEMQQLGYEEFTLRERERKHVNGVALVKDGRNLYILGKPGAGKTTFLKYITIQAARHQAINRVPIFISLNDWARRGRIELLDFITYQFDICNFPDARTFVERLLLAGNALLLFDGLDEVKQENEQRLLLSGLIQDFVRKYNIAQHLITCRIAADEYVFQGFRIVEVADFTAQQVKTYAEKWFGAGSEKAKLFLQELDRPAHRGVHELCNTPLLLSLICLAFDDNLRLGESRIEIYENAIDALLRRWDASRSIQRDVVLYGRLRPPAKMQMLAEMAAITFQRGDYFIRQRDLETILVDRLAKLPNAPDKNEIDGRAVLKEIEAQHSLFVERATGIYSFSHLTLQEYFAAYFIKDHGQIKQLITKLPDKRWREVFQLTASLLSDADAFFGQMQLAIDRLAAHQALYPLLQYADQRTPAGNPLAERRNAVRLAYIILALARARARSLALALDRTLDISIERALDLARTLTLDISLERALDLARALARALASERGLVRDLDRSRGLARDLDRTRLLARSLARSFSVQVGLDYGLYYAWAYARLFTTADWPRTDPAVQQSMVGYRELLNGINELAQQANEPQRLLWLQAPATTASPQGWQQFADKLYALIQARDLVHDWQFTDDQVNQLNYYFYANELLVQCLNVAVVSDRQAILAGLLAPPKVDKETRD